MLRSQNKEQEPEKEQIAGHPTLSILVPCFSLVDYYLLLSQSQSALGLFLWLLPVWGWSGTVPRCRNVLRWHLL